MRRLREWTKAKEGNQRIEEEKAMKEHQEEKTKKVNLKEDRREKKESR